MKRNSTEKPTLPPTLHYTTPNHTTLYHTILHYITPLHHTILHYTTLHCTTLHYTTLHYTTLHHTTLHHTTLHHTTTQHNTTHYTTLYWTTLNYIAQDSTSTSTSTRTRKYTNLCWCRKVSLRSYSSWCQGLGRHVGSHSSNRRQNTASRCTSRQLYTTECSLCLLMTWACTRTSSGKQWVCL